MLIRQFNFLKNICVSWISRNQPAGIFYGLSKSKHLCYSNQHKAANTYLYSLPTQRMNDGCSRRVRVAGDMVVPIPLIKHIAYHRKLDNKIPQSSSSNSQQRKSCFPRIHQLQNSRIPKPMMPPPTQREGKKNNSTVHCSTTHKG